MASGTAKAALFDAMASVAQALGSGRRAEIVDVLAQGERSVEELASEISQSVANTSQHLQVLAHSGLVRSRREGTRVFYRLASERVAELWAAVRDVAVRHVAEVSVLADEYLGQRDGVEQLSAEELALRLERGDVVVLDVRPEAEFRAGHIAGARSAPVDVVDAHADLVDDYVAAAAAIGAPIVAVFETHVQADHVSGLPALVERTGATAYLPAGAQVEFEHVALGDGGVVELGNTIVTAIATPGHAPAHLAFTVADRRRGDAQPWLVFSGDSLLIGDVGRPDLHVDGDARGQARLLHESLRRLLELPDHVLLYPSHYGGSVCGRGLSGNPFSSIGFERSHNPLLSVA